MRRLLAILLALVLAAACAVLAVGVTSPRPRFARGWLRLADLPSARGESASASLDALPECPPGACSPSGHVYVAGGMTGAGRSVRTVSILFPGSNLWVPGPDLPAPRDHASAAALGGTVFVSGGSSGVTGSPEPNLWAARADGSGWDVLGPMPEGRAGHAMVAFDGRLYVIGGRGLTGRVLIYDPASGWSAGAAMPRPRNHLAAVAAEGRIWAIGGRDSHGLMRRVDLYNPALDLWTRGPDLPEPMSAMGAGVLSDGIHVVGGERPSVRGGVIDRHYRLDLTTLRWRRLARPIVAVHGVQGAVVDGRLVIAGGARRQGALSLLGWTGLVQAYGGGG